MCQASACPRAGVHGIDSIHRRLRHLDTKSDGQINKGKGQPEQKAQYDAFEKAVGEVVVGWNRGARYVLSDLDEERFREGSWVEINGWHGGCSRWSGRFERWNVQSGLRLRASGDG